MNLIDLVGETFWDNWRANHGLCVYCGCQPHENACGCGCSEFWDGAS